MLMIVKEFEFHSAHKLPNHAGKCKYLHGHTYKLQVGITGNLGPDGMIMDFSQLKVIVQEKIVNRIDHCYLNDLSAVPGFPYEQPTAEKMVLWIVKVLEAYFTVGMVRLWETFNSFAEWRPE